MSAQKFYYSGQIAAALGILPTTMRVWRDRGVFDLGHVMEGEESNPRARRRYLVLDACIIGVAMTLNRKGFSVEEAFRAASQRRSVDFLKTAILEPKAEDGIMVFLGSDDGEERADMWSSSVFMTMQEWLAKISVAFQARDALDTHDVEFVTSINLSAIARRVIRHLAAADESVG